MVRGQSLRCCPKCRGVPDVCVEKKWYVACLEEECDFEGPRRETEAEAVSAWDELPQGGTE